MDDPVRPVVALGRARIDVALRALVRVEARDVGGVEVRLRRPLDGPFGDGLGDSRCLLDPDRSDRPEALDLGLAQERHAVGRQRQEPVDRVPDAGAFDGQDLRKELERLLELRVEVL